MFFHLFLPKKITASIQLDGSKSLTNRGLIALALAGEQDPEKWLSGISKSGDTRILLFLLKNRTLSSLDAGDAGTAFRFMTAFLAIQSGYHNLSGSKRMLKRPIGPLVEALQLLGADIEYGDQPGYPPLRIGPWHSSQLHKLSIRADISSQFISALMLISPYLPVGLELELIGAVVSRPYIEMTRQLMGHFGADAQWENENTLRIWPGKYLATRLAIEADWSAAAFWYTIAALSDSAEIRLGGLFEKSWQGDCSLTEIYKAFGVITTFDSFTGSIILTKSAQAAISFFEYDFIQNPDLVQPIAVTCAGLGISAIFTGLQTLKIKETDRIAALQTELAKVGVSFYQISREAEQEPPVYSLEGKASWSGTVHFTTYNDHRMAMSFAALSILGNVAIEYPDVVEKSYPAFWEHFKAFGGSIIEK